MKLSDERFAVIRERMIHGRYDSASCIDLIEEVDRLRAGLRLAKEWRHAPPCTTEEFKYRECEYCKARDAFIRWLEESEKP
jgi:hypothetical protein